MQEATTWKRQQQWLKNSIASLLTGLQAVGQVKGWNVQQIVFVGGTCGSVRFESFNRNTKALGVLESNWDPIRKKLVRRLLEEQDKVLRFYFAQKGGARSQGGRDSWQGSGTCQVGHVCVKKERIAHQMSSPLLNSPLYSLYSSSLSSLRSLARRSDQGSS